MLKKKPSFLQQETIGYLNLHNLPINMEKRKEKQHTKSQVDRSQSLLCWLDILPDGYL